MMMRAIGLLVLALPLAGCVRMQAPVDVYPAPPSAWNHTVSLQLGPRMLQAGLPLVLARSSPEAPLYIRHLDRVVLSVYDADDAAVAAAPSWPGAAWEPVLRLREADATIDLFTHRHRPSLDRFVFMIRDGEEHIVAYAEGDVLAVIRQALRATL